MLNRFTGEVYEGPFVTATIPVRHDGSNRTNSHHRTTRCDEAAPAPDKAKKISYETISLRHGSEASCRFSNGMKFVGSYEWDRPKFGTWMGGDWTYEGPLIVAEEGACTGGGIVGIGDPSPAAAESSLSFPTNRLLIGVSAPLPGSVLFHGKGRFLRSDGSIYEGEFSYGLAHGVGKEIFPGGKGFFCGEFCKGLRHGVGTLMEDCDDGDGEFCECECHWNNERKIGSECDVHEMNCGRVVEKGQQSIQNDERRQRKILKNEVRKNEPTIDNALASSLSAFVDDSDDMNDGPDFAAGRSKTPSVADADVVMASDGSISSCEGVASSGFVSGTAYLSTAESLGPLVGTTTPPSPFTDAEYATIACTHKTSSLCSSYQILTKQNKSGKTHRCQSCTCTIEKPCKQRQRYSSGLWCAGKYEIEDSRGTVHPDSNEVIEEGTNATAALNTDGSDGRGENRENDSHVALLNRTTWDFLPEKWLGV